MDRGTRDGTSPETAARCLQVPLCMLVDSQAGLDGVLHKDEHEPPNRNTSKPD